MPRYMFMYDSPVDFFEDVSGRLRGRYGQVFFISIAIILLVAVASISIAMNRSDVDRRTPYFQKRKLANKVLFGLAIGCGLIAGGLEALYFPRLPKEHMRREDAQGNLID